MEAIVFDVNPSLKQLTDNTQRMSDHMQRMQQKEMKKLKAARASEIDSTDISAECEFMEGDMMGSMDPDQFRGGKGAKSFLDYRRQQQQQQQEGSSGKGKGELEKGDDKRADEDSAEPRETGVMQRPARLEGSDKTEYVQHRPGLMPEKTEKARNEQREEAPSGIRDEKKKAPAIKGRDTIDLSAPQKRVEARRQEEEDEEEARKAPAKKEEPQEKKSSTTSLLALDEGFIIADPQKHKIAEEKEQGVTQEYEDINVILDDDDEDLSVSEIIDEIVLTKLDLPRQRLIRKILSPFGKRVLKVCLDFGCRIIVLLSHESISSILPEELYKDSYAHMRAAYMPELKLCAIGEEHLQENGSPFSIPRFYFAHCFDNSLGKDDFASLQSAAVLSNFKACLEHEPGHQFVDSFSSLSPVHYFAQAVESYLSEGRSPDVICGREELYDFDRSMYLYVEYLFTEINKESPRKFEQA